MTSPHSPLVLVVEDEPQMRRFITTLLETNDYRAMECDSAHMAISLSVSHVPDLVLLDLGPPDRDGLTVISQLREWSSVPIIVLSAREHEGDKISALDSGAHDYLTKPFSGGELLARIRVALRNSTQSSPSTHTSTFQNGALLINYEQRLAYRDAELVDLTPLEYKLLIYLAQHAGKVLTHRQILKNVWGPSHVEHAHYVRIFMRQLRQKFEEEPTRPKLFITETGVGYRMQLIE